jgi:hypothetical protein
LQRPSLSPALRYHITPHHTTQHQVSGCTALSPALVSSTVIAFLLPPHCLFLFLPYPALHCHSNPSLCPLSTIVLSILSYLRLNSITMSLIMYPDYFSYPISTPNILSSSSLHASHPSSLLLSMSLRSNSRGHGVRSIQRRREAHHTGQPPGTPLCSALYCSASLPASHSYSCHLS